MIFYWKSCYPGVDCFKKTLWNHQNLKFGVIMKLSNFRACALSRLEDLFLHPAVCGRTELRKGTPVSSFNKFNKNINSLEIHVVQTFQLVVKPHVSVTCGRVFWKTKIGLPQWYIYIHSVKTLRIHCIRMNLIAPNRLAPCYLWFWIWSILQQGGPLLILNGITTLKT